MPFRDTQTSLLTLQEIASGGVVVGTPRPIKITVTDGKISLRIGRRSATAFTAAVNFRIETSPDVSGNRWNPDHIHATQLGSSVADQVVNGTVAAGATVITMASTTGFIAGDDIFCEHTTPGNSEWARVKSISADVSVTIEEALAKAQTGSTIYDQAEIPAPIHINLRGVRRIRVVADGSGGGQPFAVEAIMLEWGG